MNSTEEIALGLGMNEQFDRSMIPDLVPEEHYDDIEGAVDQVKESETALIHQDARASGGGAEGGRTEATVELHFHIGDVTNVNITVDSEEERESTIDRILGRGDD